MCKVTGGYLNHVSFAEYTGHLMPAPNGPCDIVVFDFLTVTHIVTERFEDYSFQNNIPE